MSNEEYKYEVLVHLEIWNLCLTPCGLYYDINLDQMREGINLKEVGLQSFDYLV